ncbi:MAG: hypothetical protein ACLFO2_03425 [Candidatus Woesearchaeota archaeon]
MIARPLQAYQEAPLERKLEASFRSILRHAEPLTEEAVRNHRQRRFYHTKRSLGKFFNSQQTIDGFYALSDDLYWQEGITRGGNRPGVIHIEEGAFILQTLGFPTNTILTYIGHDYEEDKAKDVKHLNELRRTNPLARMPGFDEDIARLCQTLSDNHMFIAKQLKHTIGRDDPERKYYNVKSQTIQAQLDRMWRSVSEKDLKKVIEEVDDGFRQMRREGKKGPEIMTLLNRNSYIYHKYVNHMANETKRIVKEDSKGTYTSEQQAKDLITAKAMDGLHNSLDLEHSDSQRRTRRMVKEYEILRLTEMFPELMDDKMRVLHYGLMEMLMKHVDNYHSFLNIPDTDDKDELKTYQREMESKLEEDPDAVGYKDLKMMRRHEEKVHEIGREIERKGYKGLLSDYKRSGDAEETLDNIHLTNRAA